MEHLALVVEKKIWTTMMELKLLRRRFREFGGWRLIKEYAKMGIVSVIVKTFCKCIIQRESLRAIYPAIRKRVCPRLVSKYRHIIQESKKQYENEQWTHEHPKVVWWCWLQGEDHAPAMAKACLRSLRKHLAYDYEIRVINERTWKEWVTLPQYIVEKREKGRIPAALFSDLLRLELLIKYGGTWIDSTVFCTRLKHSFDTYRLLDADLFLFQYTKIGSLQFGGISNWFISAHSNNKVLMTMRDALMAYWRDYDCTVDYYIFHLFFGGMTKVYPKEIAEMPYAYSGDALILMKHWSDVYDEQKWEMLTSRSCFHKLSNRPSKMVENEKTNIYNRIINNK